MSRLRSYRKRDKQKKRDFDLTFEDMLKLKTEVCFYCAEKSGGYDRMDNSKGHVRSNVVPCCFRCNRIKGENISVDLMIEIAKTMNIYYAKNNKS